MNEVDAIEVSIEDCKAAIALDDSLEKLWKNPDFKAVIVEGYFRSYAIDMVNAKSNPGCQREEVQTAIIKSIDGIGALRQYFAKLENEANMAKNALAESEEELEILRTEGVM